MTKLNKLLGKAIPDPELNDFEITLLKEVEVVIERDIKALADTNDKTGRYPTKSMEALRSTPAFKIAVPKELGDYGVSHSCSLELQCRLAIVDGSVAQLFKVHDELVREIFQYCPSNQSKSLASAILNDNAVLGLAVAEPGRTATDPLKTTVAQQENGDYLINGFKIYTTAAAEADLIATWAFNSGLVRKDNPLAGMQLFLIPRDTPGVTVNRDWQALGQRATDSGSIKFENVVCLAESLASEVGKAPLIHSSLRYQAGFAALLVGFGLGALRAALPYIQDKSRPWAACGIEAAVEDPFIRRKLGEHIAELNAAYVMVQRCGRLLDAFERGEIDRAELALPISSAKICANEASLSACSAIHSLMGTGSVLGEKNFDYWWRNARTLSLHDPVEWKLHRVGSSRFN